ncbi:MAG: type II toxin-antitoxin system RelB/DinJ family antitoxin [Candidatus Scalindua sp.]|nr:type II toxin-antitoxin system RelB/DinJ family antitoxin [Candidatus Scalindua sp.]MCR4345482.1 type II toxin-antitoxin system RelB/DinJ family antitoxin [Candidatus Scalindua sp.]
MPKTAMIRARIEPKLKDDVEYIFKKLGITTTEAISLFYNQIKLRRGIPFEINIPNETTRKAIMEADKKRGIKKFKSVHELTKELDS